MTKDHVQGREPNLALPPQAKNGFCAVLLSLVVELEMKLTQQAIALPLSDIPAQPRMFLHFEMIENI